MSLDGMFTTKELAAHLALSQSTLRAWRLRGEGPPFIRLGARNVRYPLDQLERWIESCASGRPSADGALSGR